MLDFGKVAVLLGGRSAEREISLKSGHGVLSALQRQGIDASPFDPAKQALSELKAFDRAFIMLHGRYGEDGSIQGALEFMQIPYTGSGVMASALAMDKWRTKLLWQASGLQTPESVLLDEDTDFASIEHQLGLPIFVKPVSEGSSIGITKVSNTGELEAAYKVARQYDQFVMAERAVLGGEYTVSILGDTVLPIIQIVPTTDFYDYDAKYFRDDTKYLCPCGLSSTLEAKIQAEALHAFRVLGCKGWGRIDFLMEAGTGNAYFLEANTLPGMTDHSLFPMAARAIGMNYDELVVTVLKQATLG